MGNHEDREFFLEFGEALAGANPFSVVRVLYNEWRKTQDIDLLLAKVDEEDHKEFTAEIKDHLKNLIEANRAQMEVSRANDRAIFRMLAGIQDFLESKFPQVVNRLDPMKESSGRQVQPSPSSLLQARRGVVPFVGRDAELRNLQEWCDSEEEIALRLYTGAGGMGKTRLMIEVCAEAREQGWRAGFLKDADDGQLDGFSFGSQKSVLVVLDYAERRSAAVVKLLKGFLANTEAPKVRVVLQARADGDWWDTLQRRDSELDDLFGIAEHVALLAPSGEDFNREQAYQDAMTAFAEKLQKPAPATPPPDISKKEFDRILILHMAALGAVYGDDVTHEDRIFKNLAQREERYLEKQLADRQLAGTLNKALFQTMILATLIGGAESENAALELVCKTPLAKKQTDDVLQRLAELLLSTYPGQSPDGTRRLCGVEPDLFGEYMVCRWLKEKNNSSLLALAIERSEPKEERFNSLLSDMLDRDNDEPSELEDLLKWLNQPDEEDAPALHTLTVLTRIAQRREVEGVAWLKQTLALDLERLLPLAIEVAQETGDPIGQVAAKVLEEQPNVAVAESLENRLPDQSTALRELAMVTTKIIYQTAKLRMENGEAEAQEDVARYANNLGVRLSDLGHREDALNATKEAVTIRRKLAEQRPDAFLPDLAGSLCNMGIRYSNLGQREAALQATKEAVTIYQKLAKARPDAFLPYLAMALHNTGIWYSNLGQREDALKVTQKAVTIRRKLTEQRPDAFLPDLASALNNLGIRYSDLGHREDALNATKEALTIYRKLTEQRPDAFLPDLANALNNMGAMYSYLGHREDALNATKEALTIYRKLAEQRPDAFLPDLAKALNNLGAMYSDLGHREDALQATKEALTIYRKLAEQRPDAFLPDLAKALNNLGIRYSDLGRREDALKATEEALTIYKKLAEQRPDAFLPDLASALNNLGTMYSELGHREDALQAIKEAVESLGPLFLRLPQAYENWMEVMARNYQQRCQDLNQEPDATLLSPILAKLVELNQEQESQD